MGLIPKSLFSELNGKNVTINVAFREGNEVLKGKVTDLIIDTGEHFIFLDNNILVNIKYIKSVEINK